MMAIDAAMTALNARETQSKLENLYGDAGLATQRYAGLICAHRQHFGPGKPLVGVSAPGRAELIGNHTDHNQGKVLACAVNLDVACVASKREDHLVILHSQGFSPIRMSLDSLAPDPGERGTTLALIRGVAFGMQQAGLKVGGFEAVAASDVLVGSGLSSSAAFEVLIAAILDALYNGFSMDAVLRAQIAKQAENDFFGKPSGLMDQMACSVGGLVQIDFKDQNPSMETLHLGFQKLGFAMLVVNTGGSHDDLTHAYSSIPAEMQAVAGMLGAAALRGASKQSFQEQIFKIRAKLGDRAVLRALHFYQENERVDRACLAVREGNLPALLEAIQQSGTSSWTLLQNIAVSDRDQPMALALALAQEVLKGEGAVRVHGGGFAGTTINFVPIWLVEEFVSRLEAVFGKGSCLKLDVRQSGPVFLFSGA